MVRVRSKKLQKNFIKPLALNAPIWYITRRKAN